jgi:hypothetical protein
VTTKPSDEISLKTKLSLCYRKNLFALTKNLLGSHIKITREKEEECELWEGGLGSQVQ